MAADIFSKFKKSMEVKFTQEYGSNQQSGGDITGKTEKFLRLGPEQDARKVEMIKAGKEIAEKRGIAFYNPMMHMGAPLGQRAITPYTIPELTLLQNQMTCTTLTTLQCSRCGTTSGEPVLSVLTWLTRLSRRGWVRKLLLKPSTTILKSLTTPCPVQQWFRK